jgi:transcriptional regulator with XRE-family HTH domain
MADGFGRRLKELREAAGLTQESLARAADVSVSSVSKLEQRGEAAEPEPAKAVRKRKGK